MSESRGWAPARLTKDQERKVRVWLGRFAGRLSPDEQWALLAAVSIEDKPMGLYDPNGPGAGFSASASYRIPEIDPA